MNERLLEFVKQAGISTADHGRGSFIDDHVSLGDLERFAQLIRADEREACALECIAIANKPSNLVLGVALECAIAIRARG